MTFTYKILFVVIYLIFAVIYLIFAGKIVSYEQSTIYINPDCLFKANKTTIFQIRLYTRERDLKYQPSPRTA